MGIWIMSKESKIRVQGFKDSSDQVKDFVSKHWSPRALEPLNPHGFTLIEVILIMMIVGILAAFLMPRIDFALSTAVSVDGAASMVASDIRYVQECAMANRVSKTVRFIIGQSAYTFDATVPPTNSLDPSGQLPPGVTITNNSTNPYIVTFNSLGEPVVGEAGWVEVTASGQTKRITVENYTGKASIP